MKNDIMKPIRFENLDVIAKPDSDIISGKPVFYLPSSNKNSIYSTEDMYTESVFRDLNDLLSGLKINDSTKGNYLYTSIYQFIDACNVNINIILMDGLYNMFKVFGIKPCVVPNIIKLEDSLKPISNVLINTLEAYKEQKNKSSKNLDLLYTVMGSYLSNIKGLLSAVISNTLYSIINETIVTTYNGNVSKLINMAKIIAENTGIEIKIEEDGSTNIDRSAIALVFNACVEQATIDIKKISEIIEINAINTLKLNTDII